MMDSKFQVFAPICLAALALQSLPLEAHADQTSRTMIAAGLPASESFSTAGVKLFNVSVPSPGPDDILVNVKASSLNHLDLVWKIFGSALVWDAAEAFWSLSRQFPKVLGMDMAGTVVEVGSNVKQLKVGDDVWAFNAAAAVWDGHSLGGLAGHAWAPYAVLREKDAALKPKSISFIEAGSLPLIAQTSLHALKTAGAPWKNGSTVLILGATGGTGHVAVQLAKALGASIVITTASGSHRDFVHSLGADRLIDYHTEDWWNSSVIPDGTLDAIYDTVLQPETGDRAYKKLRDHGKYVTLCTGIPTCGAPMPSFSSRWRRPSLSASALRCVAGNCASRENLDMLRSLVDTGKLQVHIDATVSLQEVQHGIDRLNSHHVVGKVALAIGGEQSAFV